MTSSRHGGMWSVLQVLMVQFARYGSIPVTVVVEGKQHTRLSGDDGCHSALRDVPRHTSYKLEYTSFHTSYTQSSLSYAYGFPAAHHGSPRQPLLAGPARKSWRRR